MEDPHQLSLLREVFQVSVRWLNRKTKCRRIYRETKWPVSITAWELLDPKTPREKTSKNSRPFHYKKSSYHPNRSIKWIHHKLLHLHLIHNSMIQWLTWVSNLATKMEEILHKKYNCSSRANSYDMINLQL